MLVMIVHKDPFRALLECSAMQRESDRPSLKRHWSPKLFCACAICTLGVHDIVDRRLRSSCLSGCDASVVALKRRVRTDQYFVEVYTLE